MNHESVDDSFYEPKIPIVIWRKHDVIVGLFEEFSAITVTWLRKFEIEVTRETASSLYFFSRFENEASVTWMRTINDL